MLHNIGNFLVNMDEINPTDLPEEVKEELEDAFSSACQVEGWSFFPINVKRALVVEQLVKDGLLHMWKVNPGGEREVFIRQALMILNAEGIICDIAPFRGS